MATASTPRPKARERGGSEERNSSIARTASRSADPPIPSATRRCDSCAALVRTRSMCHSNNGRSIQEARGSRTGLLGRHHQAIPSTPSGRREAAPPGRGCQRTQREAVAQPPSPRAPGPCRAQSVEAKSPSSSGHRPSLVVHRLPPIVFARRSIPTASHRIAHRQSPDAHKSDLLRLITYSRHSPDHGPQPASPRGPNSLPTGNRPPSAGPFRAARPNRPREPRACTSIHQTRRTTP